MLRISDAQSRVRRFFQFSDWAYEAGLISFVNNKYYHNLLQFHNLQMVIVQTPGNMQSDIEPEHDNIAILHFIGLALQPDGSVFTGGGIAAGIY